MKKTRHYSFLDQICLGFDQALRTLSDRTQTNGAPYPANAVDDTPLPERLKRHSAGLMRVNHTGEVCAQALYHGQGMVAKTDELKSHLAEAAIEEGNHLAWCKKRLDELDSHTSYLNLFWYSGSFTLGMLAGLIGDQWSLGFIVETERQVITHLKKHMARLPEDDHRSLQILEKMEQEEASHRDSALQAGAEELPYIVKKGMSVMSKIMVKTAYWI